MIRDCKNNDVKNEYFAHKLKCSPSVHEIATDPVPRQQTEGRTFVVELMTKGWLKG